MHYDYYSGGGVHRAPFTRYWAHPLLTSYVTLPVQALNADLSIELLCFSHITTCRYYSHSKWAVVPVLIEGDSGLDSNFSSAPRGRPSYFKSEDLVGRNVEENVYSSSRENLAVYMTMD